MPTITGDKGQRRKQRKKRVLFTAEILGTLRGCNEQEMINIKIAKSDIKQIL